jgi:hypothetical protein
MALSDSKLVNSLVFLFDKIKYRWESPAFMKSLGTITVIFYLLSLFLIELRRSGILGEAFSFIPTNHFKSIQLAFTLLLFFEVISMVFSLEKSVSKSMHIQLEILSLILLRSGFKLLGEFPETITWEALQTNVFYVFTDAFGALMIFVGVLFIKKFEKNLSICRSHVMLKNFIKIKKLVSLLLLVIFAVLIIIDIVNFFREKELFNLFYAIYTTLIFSDVLLVLLSLRYSESYLVLFRNSGFALGTVIIRLTLDTKPPYNAIMGVIATLFVLALVYFYNKAYSEEIKKEILKKVKIKP